MVLMHTPLVDTSMDAIDFNLPATDGKTYTLAEAKGEKGTLVMFICNHCPYVVGIQDRFVDTLKTVQDLGIGVVAISANDAERYPADSFDNMKVFAEENGFTFPYLYDESQATARAYDAVCTPDFFAFNAEGKLQYRGRLDSAGKDAADADTVPELLNAMKQMAESGTCPAEQTPSMGCSIKWKEEAAA